MGWRINALDQFAEGEFESRGYSDRCRERYGVRSPLYRGEVSRVEAGHPASHGLDALGTTVAGDPNRFAEGLGLGISRRAPGHADLRRGRTSSTTCRNRPWVPREQVPSRERRVLGIDLGGARMRTTGAVLLVGTERPRVVAGSVLSRGKTAEQAERSLLEFIGEARPTVVAVDAPLTLPPCLTCPTFCRGPSVELCELQAAQRVWAAGGHPVTERLCEVALRGELDSGPLPTMRIGQIAARGVVLARRILAGGTSLGEPGAVTVLEVYPYASLWRLGQRNARLRPRRPEEADQEFSERILAGLSEDVGGVDEHRGDLGSGHAIDALIAAYTGWLHPDGLQAPPEGFNLASGWIWAPAPTEAAPGA